MTHVHLIGIGGSGLSAIALLLLESGYRVSGSDRQMSPLARRVEAAGGRVYAGHHPDQVQGADLVVRSSAVPDDNPEVQAALAAGIPVLKRSDFLGRLMAGKRGVAVAGTHGKTTTTAMIAWMLSTLGQEPSFLIGGVSTDLGANARAGGGPHFVIEADEYDRMFLGLRPEIAVVTNVEHDHPDCYPTPQDFYTAFRSFVRQLPSSGVLLACGDDPGAARLLRDSAASEGIQARAYGVEDGEYDYQARQVHPNREGGFSFELVASGSGESVPVALQVPGMHNVRNALAAFGVADLLGLPLPDAASALGKFHGTGRRFEVRGEAGGVTVVDDYAHHPTEIRATLAAARVRYAGRRVWAVWQPHTYSRTRTLQDEFLGSFVDADRVLVTEIYAARERPPADGFSARSLVAAMPHPQVRYSPDLQEAGEHLIAQLRPGDVVLVLSAGDADTLSARLLQDLQAREPSDV